MNTSGLDPWMITAREKLKYQEQFKALQPQNGYVTGGQAKGFFLQSQLPPIILGQIWALADTDSDGKMDISEFSIACKLINLKLRGMEVPKVLPPSLLSSLTAIGTTPTITPTGNFANMSSMVVDSVSKPVVMPPPIKVPASEALLAQSAAVPLPTSVLTTQPSSMGTVPSVAMMAGGPITAAMPGAATAAAINKLVSPPGGGGIESPITPTAAIVSPTASSMMNTTPPSRNMSISERAPSLESPQGEWAVKAPAKRKYTQVFNAADRSRTGFLTGVQARGILVQSKLPQATLARIWTMADMDCDGRLSCDEFILAMFLCDKAMNGEKIPAVLPLDWIPPSYRKSKSRQGSIVAGGATSRPGSQTASRHASISSQGALEMDPAAGLPQTSFEDKRKENFDKGQAELDRRRKLLQEQQRKEKEERERKEREEAEKREKARLEAERKQQEELERQLQKQRELELEREEQRKRELEAKEAARKELEKQRLLEWEQARITELNSQKQREQERVLKQKAHNTQLNVELSTLNEKIKELSQNICETRAGVTNVKSVIDGMRTQRDGAMSEMSQLKTRIKEQNAKLLQLTQEKAKWDAKVKAAGGSLESAQLEQCNAAFASKQLIIKQLKDKVENIRSEIDLKKEDINSHDAKVNEVKSELTDLIEKCEKLYTDYDQQRTQVLEMKYNKRNENVTAAAVAASAWDTGDTWGSSAAATLNTSSVMDNNYGFPSANDNAINEELTKTTTMASTAAAAPTDIGTGAVPEGFVKYRALYEFEARNTDEISFVPGDIILVPLEQNAQPGWLAGEINGHTGWFPETYVEKIEEEDTQKTIISSSSYAVQDAFNDNTQEQYESLSGTTTTNTTTLTAKGEIEYYIAAYPYESTEIGDLTFSAGEMIVVTKKDGDWWTGNIGHRSGMFPSNYVQKADVGSNEQQQQSVAGIDDQMDDGKENAVNGNDQTNTTTILEETVKQPTTDLKESNAAAIITEQQQQQTNETTEETRRTDLELDTEVSQINTQSNQKSAANSEPAESYSRPMSRTSSLGMRAKRTEIAQVIAPYEATTAAQLSLVRGQLIMIRKKTDSGWWEGELQAKGRRRQIGWFPATYVKVLQGGRNSGRNTPVSGSRVEMSEQILDKVIALYPYKAQNDDELSFDKDNIISVLGRDEPEWWRGELNGLTGLFPSNYVGPFVTSGNI